MEFDTSLLNNFTNSLNRCEADAQFLNLFYKKFIVSNEIVKAKFRNTDMAHQKMVLHASLHMIMLAIRGNEIASDYMDRVASRHSSSQLDIHPELYNIWLETLIETVSETDPEFNDEIENAWRKVMSYGIDYMSSRYYEDQSNNK